MIDEAEEGKASARLIQVVIEYGVQPPHGFRSMEWADLRSWNGDANAPEFIQFATGIVYLVARNKIDAIQRRIRLK